MNSSQFAWYLDTKEILASRRWENAQIRVGREWEMRQLGVRPKVAVVQVVAGEDSLEIQRLAKRYALPTAITKAQSHPNKSRVAKTRQARKKTNVQQDSSPVWDNDEMAKKSKDEHVDEQQAPTQEQTTATRRVVYASNARKAARPSRTGRRPCCP